MIFMQAFVVSIWKRLKAVDFCDEIAAKQQ